MMYCSEVEAVIVGEAFYTGIVLWWDLVAHGENTNAYTRHLNHCSPFIDRIILINK